LSPFCNSAQRRLDYGSLLFLTHYLKILRELSGSLLVDLRRSIVVHVHDLIAVALGIRQDDLLIARKDRAGVARLKGIKRDILQNLDDPEMTVSAVASRQRVTPRYIHMLFEKEGMTVSAFVVAERLILARRMLSDPHCAGLTVTDIAYSVGFRDLSYFDRAFRRRFGKTPSELRRTQQYEYRNVETVPVAYRREYTSSLAPAIGRGCRHRDPLRQ
jgi:AraC-like DNA-binding protein